MTRIALTISLLGILLLWGMHPVSAQVDSTAIPVLTSNFSASVIVPVPVPAPPYVGPYVYPPYYYGPGYGYYGPGAVIIRPPFGYPYRHFYGGHWRGGHRRW